MKSLFVLPSSFILVFAAAGLVQASPTSTKTSIRLDRVGDAKFSVQMKLSAWDYTNFKKITTNTTLLQRRMTLPRLDWWEMHDFKANFDDAASTVDLTWSVRGLARSLRDNGWEFRLAGLGDLTQVAIQGNLAVFTSDQAAFTIYAPEGCKDFKLLKNPQRLVYQFTVPVAEGKDPQAEFQFQVKGQVMSCLAKAHGNPKFSNLWVARAVLKNTGDQTLKDYRARFRFGEYAPWSEWQRSERVLPGQSVVDAYFPVFDLDKTGKLTGARPVQLEVEYQYERADGKQIKESDGKRVQLLGRNEVLYSTLKSDDVIEIQDWFDMDHYILPSMVTPEDPIMQQVAGWVNGQAGGVAASVDDKQAMKFLEALYVFLSANKIAYQSPPGGRVEGRTSQHVKYGRDVLQNRAGTCIDLAIFYGAACQAAGLRPILYTIPGHCFAAVQLPSGRVVAIEATGVGKYTFEQMFKRGLEELEEIRMKGTPHARVDIQAMHDQGVRGPELPALATSALKDWGIQQIKGDVKGVTVIPDQLVGLWKADYTLTENGREVNRRMYWQVNADGGYTYQVVDKDLKLLRQGTGSCTHDKGVVTESYGDVYWGVCDITWLDKTAFTYKYAKCSDPNVVGMEYLFVKTAQGKTDPFIPIWLVGTWKTEYKNADGKKRSMYWYQNADGSYNMKEYNSVGKFLKEWKGTLSFADGTLDVRYDPGWEKTSLEYVNVNKLKYEVLEAEPKANVGWSATWTRVK